MVDNLTISTPDLMTFTEAAQFLKVSRPTVYNLIRRLSLHPVAFGRNRYLLKPEVERIAGSLNARRANAPD